MASISPPTFPYSTRSFDPTPHKLTYATPKFNTTSRLNYQSTYSSTLLSHPRFIDSSTICRCQKNTDEGNNTDNESPRRWDSAFQDNIRILINWFNDYMAGYDKNRQENVRAKNDDSGGIVTTESEEVIEADWDWERWKKHFAEVDKQELIVSILESQLHLAVAKEDYEEAARIKVAMAAASTNDTVGRVMSQLNIAVKEERYKDAAFVRDYASAGLIGWWAGFSDDTQDPYGRIIRITAEHGRYLARSYNPRQLSKVADGTPLFELFITMNKKGEYKHQAVYLKPDEGSKDFPISSSNPSVHIINPHNSIAEKIDLFTKDNEDTDNDGFENILRKDMKIKVMNVTSPEKIDRDLISKVVEQIMEEEEEDDDDEDDEEENDTDLESDTEHYDIDLDVGNTIIDNEGNSQVAVKIVVGDLVQKVSNDTCKDLIRVPAKIKKKNHSSFTFLINKENSLSNSHKDGGIQGGRSIDSVMVDLAKSIGRGKIPMKVFQDVNQLINLTLSQTQNRHLLSGSTTFNRIDLPLTGDPLNGLYVGAHGIYTSEVIHLKRKFGQWKEDGSMDFSNLEFYEYVEAVKITGDPYVPAGQVAFRAKVGTKYQLPHRGIIPEEFGVIARYKGQGRLADPGFQNPRWVDGELVILDGKYTNGGPVVGFVYWAPEYHFLVFFNQLRLQE